MKIQFIFVMGISSSVWWHLGKSLC